MATRSVREKQLEEYLKMSNDEGFRQMDRADKAEKELKLAKEETSKWFEIATETRKRNDELEKQLQEAFDQILELKFTKQHDKE